MNFPAASLPFSREQCYVLLNLFLFSSKLTTATVIVSLANNWIVHSCICALESHLFKRIISKKILFWQHKSPWKDLSWTHVLKAAVCSFFVVLFLSQIGPWSWTTFCFAVFNQQFHYLSFKLRTIIPRWFFCLDSVCVLWQTYMQICVYGYI